MLLSSTFHILFGNASTDVSVLEFSSFIRWSFFQNNSKNLDPSYKMDLDFLDCLGRVELVLDILGRGKPHFSLSYSQINMVTECTHVRFSTVFTPFLNTEGKYLLLMLYCCFTSTVNITGLVETVS